MKSCVHAMSPAWARSVAFWIMAPLRQDRKMHEIICPHCDRAFKVDESGYAEILKQVRDGDFELQLHERLELADDELPGNSWANLLVWLRGSIARRAEKLL